MSDKTRHLNQLLKKIRAKSTPESLKRALLKDIHQLIKELLSSGSEKLKKAAISAMLVVASVTGSAQFFTNPVTPFYGAVANGELSIPVLADLDNDGDLDLMVTGYYGSFSYYENQGTTSNPSFASAQLSPFGLDTTNAVLAYHTFADMDNDGDLDLFTSGEYYPYGSILYFENTGTASNPSFANPVVNPFGFQGLGSDVYVSFPEAADLDGDGDFDLLVGTLDSYYAKMFMYFENTGTPTNPSFSNGLNDPFGLLGQISRMGVPRLVDIDSDGDLDLFSADYYDPATSISPLGYMENTGTANAPNFAPVVFNAFGIKDTAYYIAFPGFGDIDNDGDLDLVVGDYDYPLSSIYYYQNTGTNMSVLENHLSDIKIYPNPTSEWITIEMNAPGYINITDVHGKMLHKEYFEGDIFRKNLSLFPAGVYFIQLSGTMESRTIKIVKN